MNITYTLVYVHFTQQSDVTNPTLTPCVFRYQQEKLHTIESRKKTNKPSRLCERGQKVLPQKKGFYLCKFRLGHV